MTKHFFNVKICMYLDFYNYIMGSDLCIIILAGSVTLAVV